MKTIIISLTFVLTFSMISAVETEEQLAMELVSQMAFGNWVEVENICLKLAELKPEDPDYIFELACVNSLLNKNEKALNYLDKSIELGYANKKALGDDPNLKNIRRTKRFRELSEKLDKKLEIRFKDEKIPLPELEKVLKTELSKYLDENYKTPEDYVISKFADHDIVFLGEEHYIKQNVELIHRLIPKLYENGIYNLGIEFANKDDQPMIDSVIYADEYDDLLAQGVMLNCGVWGYREYVDILKAVWELNSSLSNAERKFRLIGLNVSMDWSHVKTREELDRPEVRIKAWGKGSDYVMAHTIIDEMINKNEKGLVYAGSYHTFTKYFQPRYDVANPPKVIEFTKDRMGNLVYNKIEDKAFNIYLHGHWVNAKGWNEQYVYPADGVIDALMKTQDFPMGFDVINSPFGDLKGDSSFFKYGYDNFTLSNFCDGYIFLAPLSELESVHWIENFVNETNYDIVKSIQQDPVFRNGTYDDKLLIFAVNATSYELRRESNIEWQYRIFE